MINFEPIPFIHNQKLVLDLINKIENGSWSGPNSCNELFDKSIVSMVYSTKNIYYKVTIINPESYTEKEMFATEVFENYPFDQINQERFDKIREILILNNSIENVATDLSLN